jgi:hypothetical protein
MFRPHLLRATFSLIFTPQRDVEDRLGVDTLYIGLGDQFDDDRRLVRAGCRGNINRSGRGAGRNTDTNAAPYSLAVS